MASSPKSIIIDTDGGVDDVMAILLALNSPKDLKVEAITTVCGNVPVKQATENILRVLELNKAQKSNHSLSLPPVYEGASKPLSRDLVTAIDVHGEDGLGGSTKIIIENDLKYPSPSIRHQEEKKAIDVLLEAANSIENLTIVTLGPLTNIALAVARDKESMSKVKEIIIMGGAFEGYGNVTLSAEYNIYADPEAAEYVANNLKNLTWVPLDATHKVWLSSELIDKYATTGPLGIFVYDICQKIMEFVFTLHGEERGLHMHDPLAVALAIDSAGVVSPEDKKKCYVQVETTGSVTLGKTVADLRAPPKDASLINSVVCSNANSEKFFEIFIPRVLNFQ